MKIILFCVLIFTVSSLDASPYVPKKKLYKCHSQYGFNLTYIDFGFRNEGQFIVQCPANLEIGEKTYSLGDIGFEYRNAKMGSPCITNEDESCSIDGALYAEKKLYGDKTEYYQSRLSTSGKIDTGFEFGCSYFMGNSMFIIAFEFNPETYDDNLDCSPPETIMEEMKKHVRHLPPEETEKP